MKGVVLDTETTGLSSQQDRVIELGMLLFEFDPVSGVVHRVLEVFDELEDPGFPIPPEVTAIHHITDDMVQGKRIDDARVARLLRDVQVVVAHNAAFDRPFVEGRWPVFEQLAWACSVKDVPWKEEGFGSAKLEYLLQTQGLFYEAHRAETDCHALLELLSRRLPQRQQPVLLSLLETLNQAQFKLYALGSPFETKDLLKQRGYRWSAELRCWTRLLSTQEQLQEETQWLRRRVYGERKAAVEIESLGGTIRYSQRSGQRETLAI
jgi:DNA polymerase-3 subunit epsilon